MTTDNLPQDEVTFDDEANAAAALREKLADALTPGFQVEFDPEEATRAGAFVEDALSEQDAAESDLDLDDATAAPEAAHTPQIAATNDGGNVLDHFANGADGTEG